MTSLCWIPPLHLYSVGFVRTNTSPMLFWRYTRWRTLKCADNKILVSENLTTLTTTSHIETFPFSKIMPAMDGIFLVGPKAKPLRWLLWHCHTTSKYAVHLPLGKCNVKSDKIQTFHDFREKHNVSKHGQIWTRELCKFPQANLKNAHLNETWILIPHLSSEKQIESCLTMQLSFFISFSKTKPTLQTTALIWRGVLPLATSMLQCSAHNSPQDCKSCIQV